MDTTVLQTPEVDLHCLELRFAQARLLEPRAIESLARSIEQSGQLIACIAVPDADNKRLILIDGYPKDAFLAAVRQAAHYGLYDLGRLEKLILQQVAGNFFALNDEPDDV